MTTTSSRSSGYFRAYTNEQKALRAKLDHLIKWTRDLKSNILKQSCKVLQTSDDKNINRQTVGQIHDELDDYKRKLDRELGRIHDICDALADNQTINGNQENFHDEILEALRRSPTYSSLEQHIYDDTRPRIRVKPRERIHPGRNRNPHTSLLSTDTIKRKASQPIALQLLDTSSMSGTKRRSQIDAFKRSRSYTNIEHTETQLGMDYVEEDENDLPWKPFGPKRSISQVSLTSTNNEQSNDEHPLANSSIANQPLPTMSTKKATSSAVFDNDTSDEEFDIAWQRREKQKARKQAASALASSKRTVHFSPSTHKPTDLIELDLHDMTQHGTQQIKDQNNNNKQQVEVINIDEDTDNDAITMSAIDVQSQITTNSTTSSALQQEDNKNNDNNDDDSDTQIIDDSDDNDDEIIALNDDEIPKKPNISSRRTTLTASEIQITSGNSQSLHNPYRIGIADPSIRSVFLPPPNSQAASGSNNGNKRSQSSNRKATANKRTTGVK